MDDTTRIGTRAGRVVTLGVTALLAGQLTCTQLAAAQPTPAAAKQSLAGLFRLTAGKWSGGAHGSYFRMLQPDGKTYLTNTSSKAGNKTFTLLRAGTDGGLRTRAYQATPKPAFAKNGDALSGKVTAPTDFFGVKFATATNSKDPQTGQKTALPVVYATGTKLSGNLSAFAASWNNQHFNQGSPKPNGKSPGFTRPVSGTYNARTKAFTITWRSLIVGGPFNKFTGEWHLTGTFVATKATKAAPAPDRKSAASTPQASTPASRPRPATSTTEAASSAAKPSRSRASTRSEAPKTRPTSSSSRTAAVAPVTSATSSIAGPAAGRLAARNVAVDNASNDSTSKKPLLVGGGVAALAVLGLLGLWLVRGRAART